MAAPTAIWQRQPAPSRQSPSPTLSPSTPTAASGKAYGTLPTPTREDSYTFDGWYTAKSGGTQITNATIVSTAHGTTLYAHWSLTPAELPKIITHPRAEQTITYGKTPVLSLRCEGGVRHDLSWKWYECDADGKNPFPKSDDEPPSAGVHYYYALVTATRQDNKQSASVRSNIAKVTVEKAVPDISIAPSATALDLTDSHTLSESELSGGVVRNPYHGNREIVPGTFTWLDGTIRPAKRGGFYSTAVFTPNNTANYTTATVEVYVEVTCSHRYGDWVNGIQTCPFCGLANRRTNTVTITWGELAYTYEDGTWQPDTHTYLGSRWTVDTPGGDAITVQNEGANDVSVTFSYSGDYATAGSFTNSAGQTLAGAVALPVGGAETVRLALSGRPSRALNDSAVGTITVRLGGGT